MTTLQKKILIGGSHNTNHTTIFLDRVINFLKPRDKNWDATSSNSERLFYHSSDFDSNCRENAAFCSDICKWLDFLVFSDKEAPSHSTFTHNWLCGT